MFLSMFLLLILRLEKMCIMFTFEPWERFEPPYLSYYGLNSIPIVLLVPDFSIMVRVFANGPGDLGSIPGQVIPKTQKMVLDTSLLNTGKDHE